MNVLYWLLAACGGFMASFGLNLMFSGPQNMDLLKIISYVLFSPLLEEFVFRFCVMNGVYKLSKSMNAAMWVQAAAFMLWHIGNPIIMPYALAMGLLFGMLYRKSGKLDAAFLVHMACNLAAVIRFKTQIERSPSVILAGLMTLLLGVWLIAIENMKLKALPDQIGDHMGKRADTDDA